MAARRMQQQHLVLLEPPMGSSLAAKDMMLAPGEVAIHLCLMASAHPQEILQA